MKKIYDLRLMIDELDEELIKLIIKRLRLSERIGVVKKKNGEPIIDKKREKEVLSNLTNQAKKYKIDQDLINKIWKILFKLSYKMEKNHG